MIIHSIILYCYLSHVSAENLTFTAQNSLGGMWSFQEGSTVTFLCINYPYTGAHSFRLNSTVVFSCAGSKCKTFDNHQDAFLFKNDISTGEFTWVVNPVKMKYNKNVFECYDGSNLAQITVTVSVKGYSTMPSTEYATKPSNRPKLDILLPIIIATILIVIIILILIVIRYCRRNMDILEKYYCLQSLR